MSALSGRSPREANRQPVLFAESSSLDGTIVPLEADPATGRLLVNATGSTADTQYSQGTTQATPTGTVAMGKDPSNVLKALSLDSSGNLNVAGSFSATTANANNNWGQALATTNASTGTIVNIASSSAGYKITGFVGHGTGDGYWFVQVAGTTILSGRSRATMPTTTVVLPNPVPVTTGSAVTFKVTNESGSTADYEGTLLGQ